MRRAIMFRLINFWPPFLFAGIRVVRAAPDRRSFDVELKMRWWNRNYVGVHFGGSLYAMCDPFFMLILIENLGPDYVVWDKAAVIRFKRPGLGRVRAHFEISADEIAAIKARADAEPKVEPVFTVQSLDDDGNVIAEIEKKVYVRRKDKAKN